MTAQPGVSDRDIERLAAWMPSPAFTDFMACDSTHLIAHDATTRFAHADLAHLDIALEDAHEHWQTTVAALALPCLNPRAHWQQHADAATATLVHSAIARTGGPLRLRPR